MEIMVMAESNRRKAVGRDPLQEWKTKELTNRSAQMVDAQNLESSPNCVHPENNLEKFT